MAEPMIPAWRPAAQKPGSDDCDRNGFVLVTIRECGGPATYVEVAKFGEREWVGADGHIIDGKVLAWMPLPAPFVE